MKILYVAPKYDYGKHDRGFSFEHYNFFDTLYNMGNDIIYFDYMEILKKIGKRRMNDLLFETVQNEKPDLLFAFLFEYELDPKTISRISRSGQVITLNWFADDHWRFDNYSRYWAPCFNWVVTTDMEAVPKYQSMGYKNVILSQWACNHFLYKKLELEPLYDVSFVGQAYGNRRKLIDAVENIGIKVITRGQGWPSGRIELEQMIEIFTRSKINLNLSNASVTYAASWINWIDRFALYTPGLRSIWRKLRSAFPSDSTKLRNISQIKGRNFEVPGCGGFLLTEYVNGLEHYFALDKDIVCYNSIDELVRKVSFYLLHADLRNEIALNGWKTTLEKHTYVHRFNELFSKIGLKSDYSLTMVIGNSFEVASIL